MGPYELTETTLKSVLLDAHIIGQSKYSPKRPKQMILHRVS